MDDLNLESEQMDQLYDSLEALNIDISTDDDLLPDLPDDEPAAEQRMRLHADGRSPASKNRAR